MLTKTVEIWQCVLCAAFNKINGKINERANNRRRNELSEYKLYGGRRRKH